VSPIAVRRCSGDRVRADNVQDDASLPLGVPAEAGSATTTRSCAGKAEENDLGLEDVLSSSAPRGPRVGGDVRPGDAICAYVPQAIDFA
jgi:hypothetical protein